MSNTQSTTELEVVHLKVEGMTCNGCVQTVRRSIEALPGVKESSVDLAGGQADVTIDPAVVTREQIQNAVRSAGYSVAGDGKASKPQAAPIKIMQSSGLVNLGPVPQKAAASTPVAVKPPESTKTTKEAELAIRGMTCAGCVHTIEKQVKAVPGVILCEVNLATGTAQVEYDPSRVNVDRIRKAVEDAGYAAR
jgi:Cu+-exporting ATPase